MEVKSEIHMEGENFKDEINKPHIKTEDHESADLIPRTNSNRIEAKYCIGNLSPEMGIGHIIPEVEERSTRLCEEFIIKHESGENIHETIGLFLNRVKKEHNYINWNECDLSIKKETEIKNEPALDMDSEAQELTQELMLKDESNENPESTTAFRRIKMEHSYITWSEFDSNSENEVEAKIEPVMDVDSEIQEQEKSEGNTDSRTTLMRMEERETSKKQRLVCKKVFICYNCYYTSHNRYDIIKHLRRMHTNQRDHNYSRTSNVILNICMHCHTIFKGQQLLDEHVLKKHSGFMNTSKTSRLYECTVCVYKTIEKISFNKHRLTHSDTVLAYKCLHCNDSYKQERSLNRHIISTYLDFIISTTSTLYKCTKCTYKSKGRASLTRHMLRHSVTAPRRNLSKCNHCTASFKQKISLDEHVLKKHPKFISSITSKLHQCQHCSYRTFKKYYFDEHVSRHFGVGPSFKPQTCGHCKVIFKSKKSLDDHLVKKHPNFVASVSSKLYQCTKCVYKTTRKHHFDRHMSVHPNETTACDELSTCIHCNVRLKATGLDEHIVKKHPNCIESVTCKIYKCSTCPYKTTILKNIERHSSAHPGLL
nr:unnamed protein product [Callosobruchus analis]